MSLICPYCDSPTLEMLNVSSEGEDTIHFADRLGHHGHNRTYFYTDYVCANGHSFQKYNSISDANEDLGKPRRNTNISEMLRGKSKTAYGYKWKYID